MNKSSFVLFFLRLFFYLSVFILIFIHPGIAVSFDSVGIMLWLVIIPVMAIAAFFIPIIKNRREIYLAAVMFLVILSGVAGRSFAGSFLPFIAGIISFSLTYLLFYYPRWGKISVLEPFFITWVALRLLSLSRSGEDIAGQSMLLTQFLLVWTAVVFLLHSAVIYFCLNPKSREKSFKEAAAFTLSALAVLFLIIVVLPPDFVRNIIINNLQSDRIPAMIRPSDNDRGIPTRGSGRRTLPRGEGGRSNLRGIPEHNWPGRGDGSEESRQYMVKIVVSETEPVYMGNVFRGQLDPIEGFLLSSQEQINSLLSQRNFVTWFGNAFEPDFGRERQEVLSLSTLQQKYLPWRPVIVDPVILSDETGPLRYIHQVVSNMHYGDPLMLVHVPSRPLSMRERNNLIHYLEVPLNDSDKAEFASYLDKALYSWQINREEIIRGDRYLQEIFSDERINSNNEYLEKIIALLVSFKTFQYNLNPDNDCSIADIKYFLFNSAEGDCVEFSNSLALLGRLAGIPSRVVTGYLAAEGLQTMAHLRGLAALREKIPLLQQFPFDNLFMVTNIHGHSWTQFYIPDYGWLDFESTSFAIPPVGMGDFNNWDVVIPILDSERTFSQVRKFPWQAVGRAAVVLIISAIILLYALRYGRELVLYFGAQHGGRKGARSLYLLLLARLAADGKPIKPASKTAHEYTELFPESAANQHEQLRTHFKTFADIYSELRWRQFSDPAEMDRRFQLLCKEYDSILSLRKRGLLPLIVRIFSLRGLAYL